MPRFPRRTNREQVNLVTHNLLRRSARRMGLDIVRADFNSPVVHAAALEPSTWERAAPLHGIDLDLEGQIRLLEGQLAPLLAEFRPPLGPQADPSAFYLDNPWYGPMDAHILYAMLRHAPPARVLELGSGYSTLVIERALAVNSAADRPASHDVVDPHPSHLLTTADGRLRVRTEPAASLGLERFAELAAGDVLFIDTTHVVRAGGEVTRLVLEVLPMLAQGVVVHFHDIFRPFEYPRVLYERFNVHWQEHYLVQAFLAYNPNFRVVCSNHALWRMYGRRIGRLFPGLREGMAPSAFWIVRTGGLQG
ncbi:MAG: class I SAM-dependent methyltransferase [Solirubrobacteraceae bacterium]